MLSPVKLRIMVRAARTRMANGEALEDILAGWPRLSADDKQAIRDEIMKRM